MAIAYLNGEWMAPADAKVSVFDRGFMFGDGIYEVMAVYDGKVFTLEEHLVRLKRSLGAIRLESPHTDDQWRSIINEAV
ncbi:MAG: aminotransferase class IV, partial [Pseudomonadales bacterium]